MANALTLMPWTPQQFFDLSGRPAAGYQLFTYAAGTTTKLDTYTGASTTDAVQANPVLLNSSGMPASAIYLQARNYKFVLAPPTDTDPPTSPIETRDNVAGVPPFNVDLDITGTAGETISVNDCVYLSAGDGGKTVGFWYKADADFNYASSTARVVGFAITAGTASSSFTIRRMGRVTGMSGLGAGNIYYASATAGAITTTAPGFARRVGMADSTTTFVIAAEIADPQKGYIPLDLSVGRILNAGATQNAAANGGLTASDSAPIYQRVNGATDKALRLNYAATVVAEVVWSFSYPPDLDDTSPVEVHLLAASGGATNSPVMGIAYFEGVGDANAGGNTAAITGTTVAEYSVTIAAVDVGTQPNFASVSLVPAAHGTDALFLYAIWIEYVKKLFAS